MSAAAARRRSRMCAYDTGGTHATGTFCGPQHVSYRPLCTSSSWTGCCTCLAERAARGFSGISSGKGVLCPNTISPVSETARPGKKIQSLNVLSSQDRWLRLKMAASQDGCVSRHSTQSQDGVSCDMENVSQDTTTSQDASIKSQYGGTSRHAISPWERTVLFQDGQICVGT